MLQEPPIVDEDYTYARPVRLNLNYSDYVPSSWGIKKNAIHGRWSPLFDTLSLTKVVFPDLLQLMNIEDYRSDIMNLLETMVDSGYLKAADYETSFPKLYLEAKQLLKKQLAKESKVKMEIAVRKQSPGVSFGNNDDDDASSDAGNADLD